MNVVRAAISAVPYLGTYLDLTLAMPGQKFVEERLEYLINQLHKEIEEVKDVVMDNAFFQTEEGFDLITKTFQAAAKTRQREKLKLFAKVLRGAYTYKATSHDPELYVRIVDDLRERELDVVFVLYRVKTEMKTNPSYNAYDGKAVSDAELLSKEYFKYSKEELEFILPRIEKTGLIKEVTGSYMGLVGGTYQPTSLCSMFISFVQNNE